jgi:hypothetical protein
MATRLGRSLKRVSAERGALTCNAEGAKSSSEAFLEQGSYQSTGALAEETATLEGKTL